MRYLLLAIPLLLATVAPAHAQVSISIGINVPVYPQLVRVPGYPVYYAPRANSNYFFYDGLYWVFQDDNWYSSGWYNGPWRAVGPEYVPLFILRIPVRYYRQPPSYFRGWLADAPPRWGEHWGGDWQQRRPGWDQWDRRSVPAAAPLPTYQRQYSGARYPRAVEQQQSIRSGNYRYQPREEITRQQFQQQGSARSVPAEPQTRAPGQQRSPAPAQIPRSQPPRQQPHAAQPAPQVQRPQVEPQQRSVTPQMPHSQPNPQRQQPRAAPPAERSQAGPQGKGRENKPAPQDKDRENKNEERGQNRR